MQSVTFLYHQIGEVSLIDLLISHQQIDQIVTRYIVPVDQKNTV